MPFIQCEATKGDGSRCRGGAQKGTRYCGPHQSHNETVTPTIPTTAFMAVPLEVFNTVHAALLELDPELAQFLNETSTPR